jgi:hypothetical protein
MKHISLYFAFARSGGTLINQLLGCEKSTLILSEVSPQKSVMPIEEQLLKWHHLIGNDEAVSMGKSSYLQKIDRAYDLCRKEGRRLCVRDWIVINYFPGIDPETEPSYQSENLIYLEHAGYKVDHCAIVRRTDSLYRSLKQYIPYCANLNPEEFAEIYSNYVRFILDLKTPIFRLEEIQSSPREGIDEICSAMNLRKPESISDFHQYEFCTGNNSLPAKPASASAVNILRQKTENYPMISSFIEIDKLLGYE